jgi:hypothetical protein
LISQLVFNMKVKILLCLHVSIFITNYFTFNATFQIKSFTYDQTPLLQHYKQFPNYVVPLGWKLSDKCWWPVKAVWR